MFLFQKQKSNKGFTLVELMIVVAVIGLLSSVVLASFTTARKKGRVVQRVSDIKQVQAALEFYYAANRAYPTTAGAWQGVCPNGGSVSATASIPNLSPLYIRTIPTDPQTLTGSDTNANCYLYKSDGQDYAFRDDAGPVSAGSEMLTTQSAPNYLTYPELIDPARDGGVSASVVDGSAVTAWKVSSPGGVSW